MGMFDNVVFLDQRLTCPAGHPIGELQTKSFPDPSMSTYLVQGERVFLAERGPWDDEDERSAWRISVDFRLTFREGEPMKVERVSGDRGALVEELRRAGLRVLSDDDPLAIAHREIKRARGEAEGRGRAFR
jgi:hypothetical protein